MITKVQKWGNSQGLRLSKHLLEDAHISVGDAIDVVARDGSIIITPTSRVRGKYDLRQLISRIPKDHSAKEADLGAPVGKEIW